MCSPALAPADDFNATTLDAGAVRILCLSGHDEPSSTGSGFTLAGGTYLVTNWHVVACTRGGGQVQVLLDAHMRETVTAEVMRFDEAKDLAVLRLARPIRRPDARFATMTTLAQRDPVVVVGFPGSADTVGGPAALTTATLTQGVVGRLIPAATSQDQPLIQVSAAINPGNSGGPLFDEAGRVVGIVTMKSLALVPTVTAAGTIGTERVPLGEGVGWAVASDALLPLLDRHKISYQVSSMRLWALERWWHREPVMMASLGLLLLLILSLIVLMVKAGGRTRVQEGLTRLWSPVRQATSPRVAQQKVPMASHQPVLLGVAGPYAGKSIPLKSQGMAIGRNPTLTQLVIPADQAGISQRHAVVGYDPGQGGFYVEDCWSTNGVFLLTGQGQALRVKAGQAHPLKPGARFYLATPAVSFEVNYQ